MTSQLGKRGVISAQRRRQLRLLIVELQTLQQTKFQDIRNEIQDVINDLVCLAERTREGDRQSVIDSLKNWQDVGSTQNDLVEETGLTLRAVRSILDELQSADPPLVIVVGERQDSDRGRPAKVYDLAK